MDGLCRAEVGGSVAENPTMSNRLKRKKEALESELKQVNMAIDIMERNPEMASLLDIVSKVRC